jgi:hypothetical protein
LSHSGSEEANAELIEVLEAMRDERLADAAEVLACDPDRWIN